ncbi:ATP-dependent DNA helicase [Caerostris darwini]|uniref:ATP-dependent DNA helicase n=1 Tax=Caerostris darwini TaxID=1538125 RepID=A0AAV4R9J9_9ARAC|nr:ATP-dependent DNA helicase [Caerostris darwini]
MLAEAMTIHKPQGATFKETAVGFGKGLTRALQYVSLSHVTGATGLSDILDNNTPPPPPHNDDPILQELKRLRGRNIVRNSSFCVNIVIPIHYKLCITTCNHSMSIAADPDFMNSDILLLSEKWSIIKRYIRIK